MKEKSLIVETNQPETFIERIYELVYEFEELSADPFQEGNLLFFTKLNHSNKNSFCLEVQELKGKN
jgi:hypothetical protein